MKLTESWLKEHLETSASLEEIVHKLSLLGLVVDQVVDRSHILKPFLIAEILSCMPHPQADRLQICQVQKGDQVLAVVCGAPNARAGLKTVLALEGMVIPSTGQALKKGVIRGVESQGMLCSAQELGLSTDGTGILELPADAPVGQSFAATFGYDDPLLEIEVTPNRGDCLGVRGVARDLAAAGLGVLKPLKVKPVSSVGFSSPLTVEILGTEAQRECLSYGGRILRGVQNRPSPAWLKQRLEGIGLKPISALVDITNYLCFDQGRPLHVFDAQSLKGNLQVRHAQAGEKLQALDEKTYDLDPSMLVIADERGPVALAGIMGGLASGCTLDTTTVFLESAFFDPISVARTGRILGIQSDSRYRFERGVDPFSTLPGLDQATALILEICGGEASSVVQAGPGGNPQVPFSFDMTRVKTLGGLTVSSAEVLDRLGRLGCQITLERETTCQVVPPSWRSDLTIEADLVEEIVRLVGYDQVPVCDLPPREPVALSPSLQRKEMARQSLVQRGMKETITWSFLKKEKALQFGGGQASLTLCNPMSPELEVMRPSLLPNLLESLLRAYDRGQENGALFEGGPVYGGIRPQDQSYQVAGVRGGRAVLPQWQEKERLVDVFDAKGDLYAVLTECGVNVENLQIKAEAPSWYHPGRSGSLFQGQKLVGRFGEPHPRLLAQGGAKTSVVMFEIFLDELPPFKVKLKKEPLNLSVFQPVERDFAFVVGSEISADVVLKTVRKVDKDQIRHVTLFDVFSLPSGQTSLGVRVRIEPQHRTFTEEDLQGLSDKIISEVQKTTGGVLRGV